MRSRIGIALLWALFFVGAVVATIIGVRAVADSVSKIVVAVITGAGAIMVAIATHALTQMREREMEAWRSKQDRYAKILTRLGGFVRSPEKGNDEFATAVLESYLIASPPVAQAVQAFIIVRKAEALDDVVTAMRADLELPGLIGVSINPIAQGTGDLTRRLFPIPTPTEIGGFKQT